MNPVTTHDPAQGFDPFSPEFRADPHPVIDRLREQSPVFFFPPLNIWVVSRYEDIVKINTDWQTFSQRAAALVAPPADLRDQVSKNFFAESLMASDPPRHTVSRKNANKAFTRGRVTAMEPLILGMVDELIDRFDGRHACDLINEFSHPLGVSVILGLLGLPHDDLPPFTQLAEDLMVLVVPRTNLELDDEDADADGPVGHLTEAERAERWLRLEAMRDRLRAEVADRLENPRDDLISALVHAEDADGEPALTSEKVVTHIIELITAGTDTSANFIGHMLILLEENPDQFAALRDDPGLWENAIEEGLRKRGPNIGVFRITTAEVELDGVTIPAGSLVWSLTGAAGHDPERFEQPEKFDVCRANASDHLGFGKGRHFCLGAPLARLETRIALQRLFERLPGLRLAPEQEIEYKPVLKNLLFQRLDVVWD
jgi:cytochrome P450